MTAAPATLKERVTEDMKTALRAREKDRLGALRLILAAIKQREIDSRAALDDPQVLAVMDKMVKQRRESIDQFLRAGRDDLVAREQLELDVISTYLPEPLSDTEIDSLIDTVLAATGAVSMKDMGRAMGQLKPQLQGRADMAVVSARVKARLSQ